MQQLQQKKREGNSLQQQVINLQSRFRVGQKQLRELSREKVDQESSLQQQIVCLKSTLMAKDSQLRAAFMHLYRRSGSYYVYILHVQLMKLLTEFQNPRTRDLRNEAGKKPQTCSATPHSLRQLSPTPWLYGLGFLQRHKALA